MFLIPFLCGSGKRESYLKNHSLSSLDDKKITTLKPVYLVFWKDTNRNSYNNPDGPKAELKYKINNTHEPSKFTNLCECVKCNALLTIKINSNLTFSIQDIIGYQKQFDESGSTYYEVMPKFLNNTNKVKLSDIEIINVSDEYLNKLNKQKYLDISNVFMRDWFFYSEHHDDWRSYDDIDSINYELEDCKRISQELREKMLNIFKERYSDKYKIE